MAGNRRNNMDYYEYKKLREQAMKTRGGEAPKSVEPAKPEPVIPEKPMDVESDETLEKSGGLFGGVRRAFEGFGSRAKEDESEFTGIVEEKTEQAGLFDDEMEDAIDDGELDDDVETENPFGDVLGKLKSMPGRLKGFGSRAKGLFSRRADDDEDADEPENEEPEASDALPQKPALTREEPADVAREPETVPEAEAEAEPENAQEPSADDMPSEVSDDVAENDGNPDAGQTEEPVSRKDRKRDIVPENDAEKDDEKSPSKLSGLFSRVKLPKFGKKIKESSEPDEEPINDDGGNRAADMERDEPDTDAPKKKERKKFKLPKFLSAEYNPNSEDDDDITPSGGAFSLIEGKRRAAAKRDMDEYDERDEDETEYQGDYDDEQDYDEPVSRRSRKNRYEDDDEQDEQPSRRSRRKSAEPDDEPPAKKRGIFGRKKNDEYDDEDDYEDVAVDEAPTEKSDDAVEVEPPVKKHGIFGRGRAMQDEPDDSVDAQESPVVAKAVPTDEKSTKNVSIFTDDKPADAPEDVKGGDSQYDAEPEIADEAPATRRAARKAAVMDDGAEKVEAAPDVSDGDVDDEEEKFATKRFERTRSDDEDAKPAKKRRAAVQDDDDYEDAKPAKKRRAAMQDDDDDYEDAKPAKKRRAAVQDDDDYEDAKPAKKRRAAMQDDDDYEDAKPAKRRGIFGRGRTALDEDDDYEDYDESYDGDDDYEDDASDRRRKAKASKRPSKRRIVLSRADDEEDGYEDEGYDDGYDEDDESQHTKSFARRGIARVDSLDGIDEPTQQYKPITIGYDVRGDRKSPRRGRVYGDEENARRGAIRQRRDDYQDEYREDYEDYEDYDDYDEDDRYDDEPLSFGKRFLKFLRALLIVLMILLIAAIALRQTEASGRISLDFLRSAFGGIVNIEGVFPKPDVVKEPSQTMLITPSPDGDGVEAVTVEGSLNGTVATPDPGEADNTDTKAPEIALPTDDGADGPTDLADPVATPETTVPAYELDEGEFTPATPESLDTNAVTPSVAPIETPKPLSGVDEAFAQART